MKTRILLLAAALLFSACSKKKEDPAAAGTGATAPVAAAPTTPAPTDPAATPMAPPAAPNAGPDLETAKKYVSAWLSALGRRDAAALAAASLLPFEAGGEYDYPEKCFQVKAHVTTATELEELTKCLVLDRKLAKDAKLIETPGRLELKPTDAYALQDSPTVKALEGKVRWIEIEIYGAKNRTLYLGVAEKGVQHVSMYEIPDEH